MRPADPGVERRPNFGRGLVILADGFLLVSVVVETAYSWGSLGDPYFLVKVVGWILLALGATRLRAGNPNGLTYLAAGWGWMAANFWRAVADRLTDIDAGQTLRLGSVEIVFAGSCLAVCLVGLILTIVKTNRN